MENEIVIELRALLMAVPAFSADVNKFVPLYADAGTAYPFATYAINKDNILTKEGAAEYSVFTSLVYGDKGYMDCMAMKAVVFDALKDSDFNYQDDTIELDEDNGAVIATIRFQIVR